MQIEVKNIKSFIGGEGPCLQGTLYINGAARGMVSDDSHGGPMNFSDHAAEREITEYAKGFPSEFDFMHAEILVSVVMQRAMAAKDLSKKFNESLCFVDMDGIVGITKKIKGDVEATKARWMADPKTKQVLKVKQFITSKDQLIELYFAQEESLQHPALVSAKKAVKMLPGRLEDSIAADKPVVPVQPQKKFSAEKSKLELARDVYNDPANINKGRGEMIKLFISVAGCTPAGASTYYQKLKTS